MQARYEVGVCLLSGAGNRDRAASAESDGREAAEPAREAPRANTIDRAPPLKDLGDPCARLRTGPARNGGEEVDVMAKGTGMRKETKKPKKKK